MNRLAIALVAFASFASPAFAHKASDAYLTIERNAQSLHGQWDIALRDLDNALGLDAKGANQAQSFDQLGKIARCSCISGLPQPRQRTLSAPSAAYTFSYAASASVGSKKSTCAAKLFRND